MSKKTPTTKPKVDREDLYYRELYREYYNVYKHEKSVSKCFKKNIELLLSNLSRKYNFKRYKTIDALELENSGAKFNCSNPNLYINITENGRKKNYAYPTTNSCGLVSLEMDRKGNAAGGGHWGAWVYTKDQDTFFYYDSTMKQGRTGFRKEWLGILCVLFGLKTPQKIRSAHCTLCPLVSRVRRRNENHQPSAGMLPQNMQKVLNNHIAQKNEMPGNIHNTVTSYEMQHQFCFAEALMFLEDVMKSVNSKTNYTIPKSCPTPRGKLIRIKKYIHDKLKQVECPVPLNNFMRIYNPTNRKVNNI